MARLAIAVLPPACYEPPPVVLRSCWYLLVVLAGCKDAPSKGSVPAPPAPVVVTDATGTTLAELRVSRPCRVTIGPLELIVGGPPLVASVGSTSWKGETETNGTFLLRDGERIARLYPADHATKGGVFALDGTAQMRVEVTGDTARVQDRASIPVRELRHSGGTITVSEPAMTVTGTDDLILAALLSAPELVPEVRMLAACERVLVKGRGSK